MDDKTLQALNALANKLGTTAEYLWGVLLRQAPLTGVIDLMLTMAWVIGAVLWWCFVARKTTRPKRTDDGHSTYADWTGEAAFLSWASAVFGWAKPSDSTDPLNHAKNRRVEVKIYTAEQE